MQSPLNSPRIYLSPPDVGEAEVAAVTDALRSGWVAPLGPEVDAFESEVAASCGRGYAVALSSGTAALHLGLLALGIGAGDEVVVPTLTFGATAFAVTYVGAKTVFLDVESESWNLDPALLEEFLAARQRTGRLPAAVITVDLFGRTCDYNRILPICAQYGIPVLADSAEALGAEHGTAQAGAFGESAVFSFNGNKIMTTSGGGMLVTDNERTATLVRFWATQSREPFPWYEHEQIGYNYRMSNILAALGRAQFRRLPEMIMRRREIREVYSVSLGALEGISVVGDPHWGRSNAWLSTVRFEPSRFPDAPRRVRQALDRVGIESRPVWKPMHRQPVFAASEAMISGVADGIFADGLCLPTGSTLANDDVSLITQIVLAEVAR